MLMHIASLGSCRFPEHQLARSMDIWAGMVGPCTLEALPASRVSIILCLVAGGHWSNAGAGGSPAGGGLDRECGVDCAVLHVLLHLRVCLVVGAPALALRGRGPVPGDSLGRPEHRHPHQPALLLRHRAGMPPFPLHIWVSPFLRILRIFEGPLPFNATGLHACRYSIIHKA